MNTTDSVGEMQQAPPGRPAAKVLKVLGGIVRWSWRLCSIVLMLFALTFILVGFSQRGLRISTDPEDLVGIAVGVVALGLLILAWWREGLAGLLLLLLLGVLTGYEAVSSWRTTGKVDLGGDAAGCFALGLPLLMLLSWSLHSVNDDKASLRTRWVAQIAAPVLVVALAFCVKALIHAPFNP